MKVRVEAVVVVVVVVVVILRSKAKGCGYHMVLGQATEIILFVLRSFCLSSEGKLAVNHGSF